MSTDLDPRAATPPAAKRIPHVTELHGEHLVDNYAWLRQKADDDVIEHLKAENAYTDAVMKPTAPLQEKLYKEMRGRMKEDDASAPYPKGGWLYYSRTETAKQYPIHCRKQGAKGKEQILLDLNEVGKGKPFISLGAFEVSDDGNLLAYTLDTTGYRQYTLHFKDLRSGKSLPDTASRVNQVEWSRDGKTFYYVVEHEVTKRSYRLYRQALGSRARPKLLYEEQNELFDLYIQRSQDEGLIFVNSVSKDTTETRYIDLDSKSPALKMLFAREPEVRNHVERNGKDLYVRTNKGGKNFRIIRAPLKNPSPKNWKEVVAHDPKVRVERLAMFQHHFVLSERYNGLPRLRLFSIGSSKGSEIRFPDAAYSVGLDINEVFATKKLRYRYTSLTTPNSVYEYDMDTKRRKLLKRQEVVGGHVPENYMTERIWVPSHDGVKVPVALVYKKGIKRDGSAPLLLNGYGSYGAPTSFAFSSNNLSLLDRGVVLAFAQIRGGGDMGEAWYEEGKMMKKKNTFLDFIACGDHLVKKTYTSREKMAIRGGSAGGLLIGAVINMRPDLCKTAVLLVPFVDVINTMLDETLPLTTAEFIEWGNPKVKKHYDYIKTYSPYENIEAKRYPDMLIRTSLNDSQVGYWEPAKYAAKMRETAVPGSLILFKCNMDAGHGGASGRYDALKEAAFDAAFLLVQFGKA